MFVLDQTIIKSHNARDLKKNKKLMDNQMNFF